MYVVCQYIRVYNLQSQIPFLAIHKYALAYYQKINKKTTASPAKKKKKLFKFEDLT